MNRDEVTCGLVSMTATSDKQQNINTALSGIRKAKALGADWVFLPEVFSFHGPYDKIYSAAESADGPLNESLAKTAAELGVTIFAGSVPERSSDSPTKVYNTQYVFNSHGKLIAKYRKIHLFNLLDSTGKALYCESDGFLAGKKAVRFQWEGWEIGLCTCYDLRFSNLFSSLTEAKPLDLVVAPAAFTLQTGPYHWHLLSRSRAIENMCYVVAANQTGEHSPGKSSYGHSIVTDPWGNVILDSGPGVGVHVTRIAKQTIAQWRGRLPVLQNKTSSFEVESL